MAEPLRAFLAVELTSDLLDRVRRLQGRFREAVRIDSSRDIRISWTRPDGLHLTLAFFGALPASLVSPLRGAIVAAVDDSPPVAVPLTKIGAFPHAREPRVLWIGPDDSWYATGAGLALASWHGKITDACRQLGLPGEDRPFRPHLTLGRVRRGERALGRQLAASNVFDTAIDLPPLVLSQLTLFRSEASADGHVHSARWVVSARSA
jgi:2'-5' RNA ligase